MQPHFRFLRNSTGAQASRWHSPENSPNKGAAVLRQENFRRFLLGMIALVLWATAAQAADVEIDPAMNQIRGIRVLQENPDGSLVVLLEATRPLEYDLRKLSEEDTGIANVVYLNIYRCFTLVQGGRSFDQEVQHPIVTRVRLNQYKLEPPMVRLVFDVRSLVEPTVEAVGQTGLRVVFSGSPTGVSASGDSLLTSETQGARMESSAPGGPSLRPEPFVTEAQEIRVFPLRHQPVTLAIQVVRELLSHTGVVVADEWGNNLIVRDVTSTVDEIAQVLEKIDQPANRIQPPRRRIQGIIEAIEPTLIRLKTKKSGSVSLQLPVSPRRRLQKRLAKCAPGDQVRIRWTEIAGERVMTNIRKKTARPTMGSLSNDE